MAPTQKGYARPLASFAIARPMLLGGVLIALVIALVYLRTTLRQDSVKTGLAELRRAYARERFSELRLCGFAWSPYERNRGGERTEPDPSESHAKLMIAEAVDKRRDPESLHALGVMYLSEHRIGGAVKVLREAATERPEDGQIHSDLGAALIEEANDAESVSSEDNDENQRNRLVAGAQALSEIQEALKVKPTMSEALFNLAFCHETLGLSERAESDWKQYLERDGGSGWANEARQHLATLQKADVKRGNEQVLDTFLAAYQRRDGQKAWRIISRNREPLSGRMVSEQLLAKYLTSVSEGRSRKASEVLQALLYAGDLELRNAHDWFTLETARFYSAPPRRLSRLVMARKLMGEGRQLYAKSQYDSAIDAYKRAGRVFKDEGDIWETELAQFWIAYCYLEMGETDRCLAILGELNALCEIKGYKWLSHRCLLLLSSAEFNRSEYSAAIQYAKNSLELAADSGDSIGQFNALSVLTEYYRYIGAYDRSLVCIHRCLPLVQVSPLNPIQKWRHYSITALALSSSGLGSAAIDYQSDALKMALAIGSPQMIPVSYAHLGLMYGREGDFTNAFKYARLAYDYAGTIADDRVSRGLRAYSALQLGNLYRQAKNFPEALSSYTESISIYESLDLPAHLYQAYKGRLFCYIAQHEDSAAEDELQTVLALVEDNRSRISDDEDRSSFSDSEETVYDLAIEFECFRKDNPQLAFEYSERSRARSLLHLMLSRGNATSASPSAASPLGLAAIQRQLSDKVQIVQYAVLEDRLLVWVIGRDQFKWKEIPIAQQKLVALVKTYLALISSARETPEEVIKDNGSALFDVLVKPISQWLDKQRQIYIVPDKILNYLPFAALVSSSSGKYLLEEGYRFADAPSSTVFALCSEEAAKKASLGPESALCVGNPRFNHKILPDLTDLQSAGREAIDIAALYDPSVCLVRADAVPQRVVSLMKDASVIHLALHCIVDEQSPVHSKLVLAGEPKRESPGEKPDGVLELGDIYKLRLPKTRLVVLSACDTATGRYYRGEGAISMARLFLVAGAPLTVATLWPVDSDSTADLMTDFHRTRKIEGASTLDALCEAQLRLLQGSDPRLRLPYYWASFVPIGGYASY